MKLHLYHGRIDPRTGPTDIDGNEIEDWGFDGPTLKGIESIDFTYGNVSVVFKTPEALDAARIKTEWQDGVHELSLQIEYSTDGDCVQAHNNARKRAEYFGDYVISED